VNFEAVLTAPEAQVGADLDAWFAAGGGRALERAIDDPRGALATVEAADVRGMGGAGFPAARKWAPVAEATGPAWVICNGNEDEPGTFKDRFLLAETPHQVLEGALVAAAVVGAADVVVYVNPREPDVPSTLRTAAAQWAAHPVLDALAGLIGGPVRLSVVESSGLYVGGEETAVIASVEGNFPFPRSKPPFPAQQGVHGRPTVVNNVETLAHVTQVLGRGADWYRGQGRGAACGMKLFSLSGDVRHPGLYELPMGVPLRELVLDHGGGPLGGRELKAVVTGGPSNTLLTPADLDVPLDFDSVRQRGARLGTGAMIVIGEGTSIVRTAAQYMAFFAAGSCGQCPPCRVGTRQVEALLRRIDAGTGTPADLAALENLVPLLAGSGRCGLVDGAVTMLDSSLRVFRAEFEEQVHQRRP
jgi:NADH-quinone oxidoreductase subunit F